MGLISYARNFEDVLLARALRHVDAGFYIDAGAGDPRRDSLTLAFYQRGWRGINVEPAPDLQQRLRQARPADVNLAVAVAAGDGDGLLYQLPGTLLSTRDAAQALQLSAAGHDVIQRQVALRTLDGICAEHAAPTIHFLRLDAAGAEADALAGLDLRRWRPWILLVRADADPSHRQADWRPDWQPGWQARVLAAGYTLAHADGRNRYYVAAEQAALADALRLPPSPRDDFTLCEDHPYAFPLTEWRARTAAAEAASEESRAWSLAHTREWKQKYELLEHAQRSAAQCEQQLGRQTERAQSAEQRAEQLDQARQAAAHAAEQLRQRADQAEATLHAVVHTLSWRITRPLRDGKLLAQRALRLARRVAGALQRRALRLATLPLRAAKATLLRAVRFVTARPALSYFVRRNVARFPLLVRLLRGVVLRMQAQPLPDAAHGVAASADLSQLPAAARQVFDDLLRSRRNAPHS